MTSFKIIEICVLEIVKGCYHIWAWQPTESFVIWTIKYNINFLFPFLKGGFKLKICSFREDILEKWTDNGQIETRSLVYYKLNL